MFGNIIFTTVVVIFLVYLIISAIYGDFLEPEDINGIYLKKRYELFIAKNWLNYNLTPKEAIIIVNHLSSFYLLYGRPWKYNNKFTENHFIYLINLILLNKDKNEILENLKSSLCSSRIIDLNFDRNVIDYIRLKYLYKLEQLK